MFYYNMTISGYSRAFLVFTWLADELANMLPIGSLKLSENQGVKMCIYPLKLKSLKTKKQILSQKVLKFQILYVVKVSRFYDIVSIV